MSGWEMEESVYLDTGTTSGDLNNVQVSYSDPGPKCCIHIFQISWIIFKNNAQTNYAIYYKVSDMNTLVDSL